MKDKYSNLPVDIKRIHLYQLQNYTERLYRKPELKNLFIEMTLNCNEHCRHCGSKCGDVKMNNQLTNEEIIDFLTDLKTKVDVLPFLSITGGEPLLRPNFIELMQEINKLGYSWGMTSNGTLIDKGMAIKLRDAGMKTVSISIDGLEDTHNWFRQTKDGYSKSIEAIKALRELDLYNLMVTTVVHKRSINELDELYRIMTSLGINTWRIINIEPIGRAKNNSELLLTNMEYKYMIEFIKSHRELDDMEVVFGCNHWLGIDNEHRIRNWYFLCEAGLKTGGIFYNGDIGACLDIDRKPETIQGNIRKDDFMSVWLNKFNIYRQNKALKSKTCSQCSERDYCRGDGFHTWNIDANEPELCLYNILNNKTQ